MKTGFYSSRERAFYGFVLEKIRNRLIDKSGAFNSR